MPSLRTHTQPILSKNRFIPLHDQSAVYDQCKNTSQENSHNKILPKRTETKGIKIDTECWIRSYCRSSRDSCDGSNGKCQLSRFSNVGRNYFSKASLRKRLAGITRFHCKHRSNHLDESFPRPVLRPYTSNNATQNNIYVNEVFREKQDPKFQIRIDVKPTSHDMSNNLSPTSTISDNGELYPVRSIKKKRSKPRKVTTYYSSQANTRKSRAEVYFSVKRGKRTSLQEGPFRAPSEDKKAVGRHLEWLKFLA